ncbi:MAG: hypothetical protein M1827_003540 [Pycnora praestabilis]|nr:MAG: hypothetical protein M1827_003540 [Pycnora praestabilis]
MRINSIRQAGGVNSIENFARSWQRAAGFYEIAPVPRSYRYSQDEGDEHEDGQTEDEETPKQRTPNSQKSLLREQIEAQSRAGSKLPEVAVEDGSTDAGDHSIEPVHTRHGNRIPSMRGNDVFDVQPQASSPFAGSYGASYGTLSSRVNASSMEHAGRLFREQQAAGVQEPDKEREPMLVKRIEQEDGNFVNVVVGQSTLPQTIFNSVNVLIGVGLLSLPLGIKYAGWLLGMIFLFLSAIVTSYTARILAKCLDVDATLITFADLAYISFGSKARVATSLLFSIELIATCVALVVLFGDSLDALIPGWGVIEWKIVCGIILIPLSFVPLWALSFSSALGILCCLGLVIIVFVDGLIKPHAPGSLREPILDLLFPSDWYTLPISFGLLMSPWGGHSVFPNIYKDMRHPHKYTRGLNITYGFTYLLDLSMAVAGLLMFGDGVRDEITSNILLGSGYPRALNVCIVVFIAIIPLTKVPLNARPIISTLEIFSGLDARAVSSSSSLIGMSGFTRGILKCTIRILTIVVITIIAILVPAFDRIMGFLGSAMCFTICIILPLAFYLKIFGKEISMRERVLDWFLIAVCSVMAVVGTVWAFMPSKSIGGA